MVCLWAPVVLVERHPSHTHTHTDTHTHTHTHLHSTLHDTSVHTHSSHAHAHCHTFTPPHTAYPPPRLECQESQYSCLDGQGCIAITQVCDGVEHCMDGSDELENVCTQSLNRSCDTDNGGCSHNCHPVSSRRAICTCRHGYQLGVNLTSCHGRCFYLHITCDSHVIVM